MRQIFVFTAGKPEARGHLQDSILNPVPFALLRAAIGEENADHYRSLLPSSEGFYAWGAVPGPVNKRTWDSMRPDDIVLTVYGNQYHFLSTVLGKVHDKSLASEIWGDDGNGNTWEYMYLLSPPQRISVDVLSSPVSDYLSKGYRGFTQIAEHKISTIRARFGGVDEFVSEVFRKPLPRSVGSIELELAEAEAASAPDFDPKNLKDGRKKVLREVVRRQGQPKFRKALIDAYGSQCAVTGCSVLSVLEAAHIAPYLGGQSNSVQNGLLLRADIHTLFDVGQLRITPEGRIEVDDDLLLTDYAAYHGTKIRTPAAATLRPSDEALKLKYESWL